MEYLKIIGVLLVILAGAGFGTYPVHRMKERAMEFETLYFCLLRLKSEIGHGGKPLPEAMKTAADSKRDGKQGSSCRVLQTFANRLEQEREAYEMQLRRCAEEGFRDSVLTKEEQDGFVETFLLLGGGDKEKQMQMLSYYAETICQTIGQEKQRRKETSYLYRSLGILGGIFLSVLLC